MNTDKIDQLKKALRDRELHKGYPTDISTSLMNINDIFRSKSDQEDPTKYPAW